MSSPYAVAVRDSALVRKGKIDRLDSLAVVPRFNDVGGWSFTIPLDNDQSDLLSQLAGVIIYYGDLDGPVLMSGPVTHLEEHWDDGDKGTLRVTGVSDEIAVADRLAWPNPLSLITAQTTNGYDARAGVAETVIKAYVDINAGPGAVAARQTTGLTIEADGLRGSSISMRARMKPLIEVCTEAAISGGDLGWRVEQVGSSREFQVYQPTDKTGTARFGRDLGNLLSYTYTREAPKSTRAIIGGGGEDVARTFRQVIDTTAETDWGRKVELFVDARDTTDTTELDQRGAEDLVENGPQTSLTIQANDTDKLAFGTHYGLGDKVTVEPGPGHVIQDVLREVEVTWSTDDGPRTTSAVGSKETTGTLRMIRRNIALAKRVAALEARK